MTLKCLSVFHSLFFFSTFIVHDYTRCNGGRYNPYAFILGAINSWTRQMSCKSRIINYRKYC